MKSLIETLEGQRLLTAIAWSKYKFIESIDAFESLSPTRRMAIWLDVEELERQRFEAEFPKAPAEEQWHQELNGV